MATKWIAALNLVVVFGNRVPAKQETALVQSVASMVKVASFAEQDDDHIDHVDGHIVCYSQDCSEAQATLEVYTTRAADSQRKLDECASNREQLQDRLQAAADERNAVAAALEVCARDRQDLQGQVEECGRGRAMLEQELAKCARERSILEEELRQCAEVDRPAAEAALAKCAEERAKLEKELEDLARRLEEGEEDGGSSRRRRRRRPSLLLQEEESESAEMNMLQAKLKHAKEAERVAADDLSALADRATAILDTIEQNGAELDAALGKMESAEKDYNDIKDKIAQNGEEFDQLAKEVKDADAEVDKASAEGKDAAQKEGDAAKVLAGDVTKGALAQLKLLSLVNAKVEKREEGLKSSEANEKSKLKALEAMLATKEHQGKEEECAALRVEVIQAKGNLELFSSGLAECLESKRIITAQIEAANKAYEQARQALAECVSAKARLSAALDECHDKCEQTSALLEECLARKDELRGLIDECHTRRDAARESLQQCLDAKEELKDRIEELKRRLGTSSLLALSKRKSNKNLDDSSLTTSQIINVVREALENLSKEEDDLHDEEAAATRAALAVLTAGDKQSEALASAASAFKDSTDKVKDAQKAMSDGIKKLGEAADKEREAAKDDEAAANSARANVGEIRTIEAEAS